MPIRLILLVVALVAAVLLCLPFDALADVLDAPAVDAPTVFAFSLEDFGARASFLALGVLAIVGVVRLFGKRYFAPTPATDGSVFLCRLLALGAGMGICLFGVGPFAAAISGPVAATWLMRVLDGFLVTAVAAYGRDFITSGGRVISDVLKGAQGGAL